MLKRYKNLFLHNTNKGFTFIELLLYMSIVSIVVGAIIPFAWNVIEGATKSSVQQEVFASARYISERIKYEIRNANAINTSDFALNLALPINAGKKLSLNNPTNNTTNIDVASNIVRISQNGGAAVNLNSSDTSVTNLTFTNYTSGDNKTKHVGFTLTVTDANTTTRQEYQETITIQASAEVRNN